MTKIKNQALKEEIRDYAFICFGLKGNVTAWNEGAHFMYGYKEDEAHQLKYQDLYGSADIERGHPASLLKEASRQGSAQDEGIRIRKDGSKFWASEVLTPIRDPFGDVCGYMLIVRDVTIQKLDQEILERELHSFHTLLTNFPNGVVKIFDHQLRYTLVKGQTKVMLDDGDGHIGKTIYELYPEYIWKKLEGPFKKALQGETSFFEIQVNGKYFVFNTMPVKGHKGEVQSGILIAQDLSALHKADIEVAKHNNLLRAIFEGTNDIVFVKDLEGRYMMANPAAAAIFDKTPEEVIGLNNFDLFGKEDAEMIIAMDAKLKETQETVTYVDTVTIYGKKHSFNTTKGPLFDHEGKLVGLVGISRDVTEAKKIEKKLEDAEANLNEAQVIAKICSFEYFINVKSIVWSSNAHNIFELSDNGEIERGGIRRFIMEDDLPLVDSTMEYISKSKQPVSVDFRLRLPGGKLKYLQGTSKCVLNKQGELIKIKGTLQDITQRKLAELGMSQINETLEQRVQARTEELQSKEEYFRSLIQNSSDAIQLSNEKGELLFMSDSVRNVLGYEPDELLGTVGKLLIHPDDVDQSRLLFQKLLENPNMPIVRVHRIKHKDGQWRWIESVGNNLLNNPAIKAVVVNYHDVTERVNAQATLQNINEVLEERVVQRTSQLEAANKELEAFSYSVSHDLRAPLRAITGFGQVLERDHKPHLGEEGSRILNIIMNNSQKMGNLIDDLLEFSRLGRREQKMYEFSVDSLVHDLIKEQFAHLGDKVVFSVDALPDVVADRAMVSQVFVNLISNAVKFSKAGEINHINIGCKLANEEKTFYISDEGVGFDMRYKEKLFGVFQRLHSAKEFEGTGVGLALVQRIIHRHGGKIWAESKLNAGATFYFTLP